MVIQGIKIIASITIGCFNKMDGKMDAFIGRNDKANRSWKLHQGILEWMKQGEVDLLK